MVDYIVATLAVQSKEK